jgi:hypothetical protein
MATIEKYGAVGGLLHRIRRGCFLVLALVASLGISLAFQALLVGEFGSDSSTTPDSLEYIRLAKRIGAFLGDPSAGVGDDLRTAVQDNLTSF